jgi:hypothetical protein
VASSLGLEVPGKEREHRLFSSFGIGATESVPCPCQRKQLSIDRSASMVFDDDEGYPDDEYDEGQAFVNSLVHIGEGVIDSLFRYWAEHWPQMPDRDFLPALDGVRIHVGELLGPEQHKRMWDCLEWLYQKHCAARGDKSTAAERDAVLQSCLPEWHQAAATAGPPAKLPKRAKKRRR